jgi:hypothetical protein
VRRWAFAAALITALGPWTTGHAEEDLHYYVDGQKLYRALVSTKAADQMFAYGYITGISDATQTQGLHCSPNGLQAGTLGDVIEDELKKAPEYRTLPASHLVTLILIVKWPCDES